MFYNRRRQSYQKAESIHTPGLLHSSRTYFMMSPTSQSSILQNISNDI